MCLSIPGKVICTDTETAKVSIGGNEVEVGLQLLDDVRVGEYVLVHSGFALQRISDEEARRTLELIRELEDLAGSDQMPH